MVCPVCEESMVLWSIDSLFYSIHRWGVYSYYLWACRWHGLPLLLPTLTHGFFSHLCPLLSSTTNCPPASNTALHAGNQTKNLKTSHPTQNSYCCVSQGESATKQMNPLTNDASLKYTVKNLTISISCQSSVFNHMHWSRNFWESFSVDSLSPFKEPSLSMDPYVWIVFNSFILIYLKCVFSVKWRGKDRGVFGEASVKRWHFSQSSVQQRLAWMMWV